MNEVLKAIAQRSSIRAYTAKKLTDAEIKSTDNGGLAGTDRKEYAGSAYFSRERG